MPLKDKTSFEFSTLTLGYSNAGFPGASRQIHDYIRHSHYAGYRSDKPLPVLFNAWGTFEFDIVDCDHEEQAAKKQVLSLIKRAVPAFYCRKRMCKPAFLDHYERLPKRCRMYRMRSKGLLRCFQSILPKTKFFLIQQFTYTYLICYTELCISEREGSS